jgi:hypothetical protein
MRAIRLSPKPSRPGMRVMAAPARASSPSATSISRFTEAASVVGVSSFTQPDNSSSRASDVPISVRGMLDSRDFEQVSSFAPHGGGSPFPCPG